MNNFESVAPLESAHEEEEGKEAGAKRETDPSLVSLWRRYHFMGEPPFKNSPAEEHLKDLCTRYLQIALADRKLSPAYVKDQTEDYFAQFRNKDRVVPLDTARRELHNQISLMVVGRQRTGMDRIEANEIADFASRYIYGLSYPDALDKRSRNEI